MLNKDNQRELAYVVKIDDIIPHNNADRLEIAVVNGWRVIVGKGEFKPGDLAIYFEIDSKLPEVEPWTSMKFLASKHFKIKTQKLRGEISQGFLAHPSCLGWYIDYTEDVIVVNGNSPKDKSRTSNYEETLHEGDFLTKKLKVTYAVFEDNKRKSKSVDKDAKYISMMARHPKFAKTKVARYLIKKTWGKKLLFLFLGRKNDSPKDWPVGKFPGVSKTDQERCENMPWVLQDKTPFIVTQKCDGSSGTFILEKKKGFLGKTNYEFYVCSRNVRMADKNQTCFYGDNNYYWEVAIKYDIENKMKEWLRYNPNATFVCWQGEICGPGIQGNPHHLTETRLFCFHWTDSINGRRDIRHACMDWRFMGMEVVPITGEIILPDDFEEFKKMADGKYDKSVCEDDPTCDREGFVYYKTTDPTFSFKNVSREYLLKK